jgi:lipopolysaccharide transport system permease protein
MEVTEPHPAIDIPVVRIDALDNRFIWELRELWLHRELLYFLTWREVKIRYKQTAIGVSWAVLQPFMMMIIFAVIFGKFAKIPSDGFPYPLFAFTALIPWIYFSQAVARSAHSLVGDASLLQKVYFPRLILPLAAVMVPLIDFLCSFMVLLGMLFWYGVTPTAAWLMLPIFLFMAFLTALAVGLWLAPLNVRYRDVNVAIPVLIQLWMYASPIVYPTSMVPEKWRLLYSLNPMVGVINGFRWALLGGAAVDWWPILVSVLTIALVSFIGIIIFRRAEPFLADII